MNLTTQNTAIVLDSTADFPDAPSRFPNMRVVPLYVRFGEESFRDYVELGPDDFYDRLPHGAHAADDLAADPSGLPGRVRGAVGLRAHPLGPHRVEALRHVRERRPRGAGAGRRPGAPARLADRLGSDRDARARDPAAARTRHDRRGGGGVRGALRARDRPALHGRHARVPRQGRPDRTCAGARRPAAQRQADAHHHGRGGGAAEAGPRRRQGDRRVRQPLHRRHHGRPRAARRDRARGGARAASPSSSSWSARCARRPRSSTLRRSARSSARTPARARSAFFWFQEE